MIIDLSHSIELGMPVYPGTQPPEIHKACSIEKEGFKESLINMLTHTGTHIDVPAHVFTNGKPVDHFDCEKFYGSARIINCENLERIDENLISKNYTSTDKPEFLLFFTGWSRYWGDDSYFENFPLFTTEAIDAICRLPLKGIGIDAISFDAVGTETLSNHKMLLQNDIVLIENLCNLELLHEKKFTFSCLPMKIKGADGSPVRACAIMQDE
jgi:arylformamidase